MDNFYIRVSSLGYFNPHYQLHYLDTKTECLKKVSLGIINYAKLSDEQKRNYYYAATDLTTEELHFNYPQLIEILPIELHNNLDQRLVVYDSDNVKIIVRPTLRLIRASDLDSIYSYFLYTIIQDQEHFTLEGIHTFPDNLTELISGNSIYQDNVFYLARDFFNEGLEYLNNSITFAEATKQLQAENYPFRKKQ